MNFHYCGGKIASLGLFAGGEKDSCAPEIEDDTCCTVKDLSSHCGGEDQSEDDCCDDTQHFIQFDTDQKLIQSPRFSVQLPNVAAIQEFVFSDDLIAAKSELRIVDLDLPPPDNEPLWLLNCSLTYYG